MSSGSERTGAGDEEPIGLLHALRARQLLQDGLVALHRQREPSSLPTLGIRLCRCQCGRLVKEGREDGAVVAVLVLDTSRRRKSRAGVSEAARGETLSATRAYTQPERQAGARGDARWDGGVGEEDEKEQVLGRCGWERDGELLLGVRRERRHDGRARGGDSELYKERACEGAALSVRAAAPKS